ncbi:hypothetical protein O181_035279 [Austropuccinia psidii MF-1]|uniref:DUF659 domain-containing protein n=1 Tax=Austropuccinia psidii MF-1 TaxID=1389203 RepID=A0A9Q3HAD6_9BASI|nr:hypothetical protein [Austropuccinia psidii MF-1]
MTLYSDGWTNVSGCSLYALLLLKGQHIKQFIDILDLNLKFHTSENLYEAVKNCFHGKQISFRNISAVVTDSPSVMIKFQKLLTNDNPHIVRTHCVLNSFNLIEKHFNSHPEMTSIVKGNKTLTLALNICKLVPPAAGVEGLFSVMAAIKTKYQNPMFPTTLKMIVESSGALENKHPNFPFILIKSYQQADEEFFPSRNPAPLTVPPVEQIEDKRIEKVINKRRHRGKNQRDYLVRDRNPVHKVEGMAE